MQKKLVALAVLASFAGVASAQSSVTLWGIVDVTLIHSTGSIASKTQLHNSDYASSQLGFRGSEDLGGGLSASFWLEMGFAPDSGVGAATNTNNQASGAPPALAGGQGLTFNRRSTVSLQGTWGELRLGRDWTPQYRNLAFEPFGNNGVGAGQNASSLPTGVTAFTASNSIQYLYNLTPGGYVASHDGLFGQAMYYFGENPSNAGGGTAKNDGNGWGVRVGWLGGPLLVGVATSKTNYNTLAASGVGGRIGDVRQSNLVATYDFHVATAYFQYSNDANGDLKGHGGLIGVTVPVGVGLIRASYSGYRTNADATAPTAKKLALGYVHNLSKRTAVYASYAHVTNTGSSAVAIRSAITAPGESSSGLALGLKHSF